ncbi:MAG: flagellar M-ring protein FliF [Rhizobiales bacterium]|nr:flagellar M-ring protein FliF [Hyphomicrobiales bacterium]
MEVSPGWGKHRSANTLGWAVGGFSNLIKSLGVVRLATLGVVGALLLGFFAYLGMQINTENKALLFSDVNAEDAAKMVGALDAMKVTYELKGDGTMIYVPQSQVLKLRMTLAEKGLPAGGTVGYEIFDNSDALGTTSFLQNINHLRALEGELARTIRSIDGISAARVHLVLPERELFSRDKRDPTASIVLKVSRANLTSQQVKAIQYLVSSAVEGLTPAHVSIVDERGTLLASGMGDDANTMLSATIDERRLAYESRLRTHVEDIISRVVGVDKARVEVTAQMDTTRVTQTSDLYDPNGQVVRSTQTMEDSSTNSDGKANNAVTIGNALPNANQGNGDSGNVSQQASNRNEETVNYEISRTTKTEVQEAGRVKRLSVAVLVDGNYTTDAQGNSVYAPRSAEELKKLEALVRSAMGYDESRGDQVEVVNLQFAAPKVMADMPAEMPGFMGLTKADYIRIGEMAVLAILALVAMLFVLRPMFTRLATSARTGGTLALPGNAPRDRDDETASLESSSNNMNALPSPDDSDESLIDIAQVSGKVKQSSMRKIGELVASHPDESISILRSWLHETA